MSNLRAIRVIAGLTGLLAATAALSGCVSSPTYGTGTTAAEQLVDDIGAAATIGGGGKKKNIKYAPRPGLVVPPAGEQTALVTPQPSVADKDNGQWAESPEEMRARLAQEAEDNRNNASYQSPLAKGPGFGDKPGVSSQAQFAQFRQNIQTQKGNYEGRRYLSDPPPVYRQADPAALTDLGEPEKVKEKRRRKAAVVEGTGASWWQPFQ
ncbi:hypothetical protein [Gellertiella hungarica]|uniref:Lipoprotein n=1 Tax=Gellertiella hungarica TaxID=1572859 RepID=A0A7W6J5I9_9HYPH|nr:hypothetical protein [Gellertiella hungarica]MBB4064308.1 hypothetical protein [Gellertiella hungarica]